MKRFIAKYMLYIYLNFIQEDLTIYKIQYVSFMKFMGFLNGIYVWIASIILFPIFLIGMIIEDKIKIYT